MGSKPTCGCAALDFGLSVPLGSRSDDRCQPKAALDTSRREGHLRAAFYRMLQPGCSVRDRLIGHSLSEGFVTRHVTKHSLG